jgi:4'-phosphopantetheinyl transferase
MRYILGNYMGIPGNELMFTLGEKGKPAVNQNKSEIEFNLTHCEGVALLAVTKSTPVGIDLEYIRSKPLLLKIAQRTFTDEVYNELKQLQSGKLGAAFFHHWTEFEARTKCVGDGVFSTTNRINGTTTKHFSPQEGWIACVAVRGIDISSMRLTFSDFRN